MPAARPALLSRPERRRSTRSPAPTWRTTAGACASGTPTAGCARSQRRFAAKDIAAARPDLWASDDPAALVAGETETGNANLSAFVGDGCLENGEPRRYDDLRRLNDGLRERGRDALVAYLCAHEPRGAALGARASSPKSPRDLSDLLLLDVEAGICERASRIEEAISAVQTFVRRARLHLEPGWTVSPRLRAAVGQRVRDLRRLAGLQARLLYKENWIEWDELRRARRIEAFRFLETEAATVRADDRRTGRRRLVAR